MEVCWHSSPVLPDSSWTRRTRSNSSPFNRRNSPRDEKLPHERKLRPFRDPRQQYWPVAANAVASQSRSTLAVGGEHRRVSPQGGRGEDQMRPQPLVQVVFRHAVTMSVLHLTACPGQLERPGHGADSVVGVREGQGVIAQTWPWPE